MAQLMPLPLPLTVSCFSKIQIGFTFLVPAHLGSPGKRAVKRVCVCVCVCVCQNTPHLATDTHSSCTHDRQQQSTETLSRRGVSVGSNARTTSLSSAASITLICILIAARLNGNSCVSMNGFRMLMHCSAGIARANDTAHSSAARVTYVSHTQLVTCMHSRRSLHQSMRPPPY